MHAIEFKDRIQKYCDPLPGSKPYVHTYTLSVKKADEGKSLLDFYSSRFQRISSQDWERKIDSGEILVNGLAKDRNYILKSGEVTSRKESQIKEPEVSNEIELIYIDEYILAINKPAPLPSQASGRFIKNTLSHLLELVFEDKKLFPIHRLDANTTGLILYAFDSKSAKKLNQQFKEFRVKKSYVALVHGTYKKTKELSQSIQIEKQSSGSRKIGEGKQALTYVNILEYYPDFSLLEIEPKTGRTNQIRLHLASEGHPIVGDIGYENESYFKSNPMTYPTDCLFLHAKKISFYHPISEIQMELEAPIPSKFDLVKKQK